MPAPSACVSRMFWPAPSAPCCCSCSSRLPLDQTKRGHEMAPWLTETNSKQLLGTLVFVTDAAGRGGRGGGELVSTLLQMCEACVNCATAWVWLPAAQARPAHSLTLISHTCTHMHRNTCTNIMSTNIGISVYTIQRLKFRFIDPKYVFISGTYHLLWLYI